MPSNHLILCCPLLLPSVFPSIRIFSSELAVRIRWPSIGVLASASVLPMNIHSWFRLGLTGLISLLCKGLSRVFSKITVRKHRLFRRSTFFMVQLSHPYMTTGKTIALTVETFVGKVMSLLFNMLSRFVKAIFQGARVFLISWLQLFCHISGWFCHSQCRQPRYSFSRDILFPAQPNITYYYCINSSPPEILISLFLL